VGTQTLAALFKMAPNVIVYHEPKPRLYGLSKLSYQYSRDVHAKEILQEAFLIARTDLLDYSLSCAKGYVETSPHTTFLAPVAMETVPNVKFIHVVRDPRAVVRSGMRRGWYCGHSADRTRIVPGLEAGEQWDSWTPFQKNLWLWAETNRWILDFSSQLPTDRTLLVHSEDLFAADIETLARLFDFIGASMPPQRKVARVLGRRLNVQETGSFRKGSDWDEEMREELAKICGEMSVRLDYEVA
jgi:hypothetical protein